MRVDHALDSGTGNAGNLAYEPVIFNLEYSFFEFIPFLTLTCFLSHVGEMLRKERKTP